MVERYHLPAIQRVPEWTPAGACDPSAERGEWIRTVLPGLRVVESFDALLAAGPLDAVLIATPPRTHAELAVHALEAGLAVLVEKPMCLDAAEGREVRKAVARTGGILWVGFNRRFRPTYRELADRLRESGEAPLDVVSNLVTDAAAWEVPGGPSLLDPGSGVLDDVLSHQLDLVGWLTGGRPREVRTVAEEEARAERALARTEVRLDRAGTRVSCRSGQDPGGWAERLEVRLPSGRWTVHPACLTRGSGPIPDLLGRARSALAPALRALAGRPSLTARSFQRQLRCFAEGVRGGAPATHGAGVLDGLRVAATLAACRRSLASGGSWQPVDPVDVET